MTPAALPPPSPSRPLWAALAWGCVLGAVTAAEVDVGRMVVSNNRHTVVPGAVYRSGQLDGGQLHGLFTRTGVRTVVNLRGKAPYAWYDAEAAGTSAAGVSQEDVTLSAGRLPSPHEVRRLIDVFDRSEYPILIHCQQGSDRTGLAVAVWQLLYTDATYAAARRQCSPRFGHFSVLRTARVDDFFDMYEAWLAARAARHAPALFREWATGHFKPGPASAKLELVSAVHDLPASTPAVFRLRATNTSDEPWELRAGTDAGVHARYWVWGGHGESLFYNQAGRRVGRVPPGESVEFDLPVPPMPRPGRFRLSVELAMGADDFSKYGVEQLNYEWAAVSGEQLPDVRMRPEPPLIQDHTPHRPPPPRTNLKRP